MQAIAALKQRSAQAALLYALDDPSSEVRTAAVEALASVGNARALPALLTAADRDVPGAWAAIGSLASKADLKSLFERAPEGDLRLIRPALDAMIARKDLPLESRVKMVQQVAVLGSVSARAWVADWLANIAATDPPRLRQALADGLARIDRDNALPKGFVAVNSARDPKVAKAAVGIPATTPNAEKRAAKLASPKSAVSAAPQGAK
jgi:HEAT repeat protein